MNDKNSVQVLMLCTATLLLKHVVTGFIGAKARIDAGVRAPEDTVGKPQNFGTFVIDDKDEAAKAAKIIEQRWNRITMNDLENIPLGLIVAWSANAAGGDSNVIGVSIVIFTIARIAHTIAYANAVFLPRTIAFMTGLISILVIAAAGVYAVLI